MFSSSEIDDAETAGIVCECGDNFESLEAFQIHFQNEHQKQEPIEYQEEETEEITAYQCSMCEKVFMTERLCNNHIKKVHSTQPKRIKKKSALNIICEVCGKRYSSNAALRYHSRVHTGEKPYQCPMCPKKFTMPLFLQIHVRTHTGEKPYACKQCPKAFNNRAALQRHDRVHTGLKPFACPKCGKTFTQSNSMKLHVNTVHYKMPAPYKSKARKLKDAARAEGSANKPARRDTTKGLPKFKIAQKPKTLHISKILEQTPVTLNDTNSPVRSRTKIIAKFVSFENLDAKSKRCLVEVESDNAEDLSSVNLDHQYNDSIIMDNDNVLKLEVVDNSKQVLNNDCNVNMEGITDTNIDYMINVDDNNIKQEIIDDGSQHMLHEDGLKFEVIGDDAFEDDGNVYEIVEIGNFSEINEVECSSNGNEIAILYADEGSVSSPSFINHKSVPVIKNNRIKYVSKNKLLQ